MFIDRGRYCRALTIDARRRPAQARVVSDRGVDGRECAVELSMPPPRMLAELLARGSIVDERQRAVVSSDAAAVTRPSCRRG